MAKKKGRVDERPAKATPKLERIRDEKVRLTMEFSIEELVRKMARVEGIENPCGCILEVRFVGIPSPDPKT